MSLNLLISYSILLVFGIFIERYISNIFINILYPLVPENQLPEKFNQIRKNAIKLITTLLFISIGISPISNALQLKLPNIQLDRNIYLFTFYYGVSICLISYFMVPVYYVYNFFTKK